MKYKLIFGFAILASVSIPSFSKIRFCEYDLAGSDSLIFTKENDYTGNITYKTLYNVKLMEKEVKGQPEPLTCFPDRMEVLDGGKKLQIRNASSTAWYNFSTQSMEWKNIDSNILSTARHSFSMSTSPDGKFSCYIKNLEEGKSCLIICDNMTGAEKVLVESVTTAGEDADVKWAPDSKAVLYEKNGSIYFVTPQAIFKNYDIPETYRKIGKGTIESVQWTLDKRILYIDGDVVYSIEENELYTRGLYNTVVGSGSVQGRLPYSFDCRNDRFWCNASGTKVAVISKNKILSLFSIDQKENYNFVKIETTLQITDFAGSPVDYRIFWNFDKHPVLWVNMLDFESNSRITRVFTVKDGGLQPLFNAEDSIAPVLSPDRKKVAYTDGEKFCVFDLNILANSATRSGEKVVSCCWISRSTIAMGGVSTISSWTIGGEEKLLFLSSAESPFFSDYRIYEKSSNGSTYEYNEENRSWAKTSAVVSPSRKDRNSRFRVFEADGKNAHFENSLYVRSLSGSVITYPVYRESMLEDVTVGKAVLAIDCMNDSEGVADILFKLKDYNIKAVFFINGEFIRRYPQISRQIAESGHTCASLFYTTADLTENSFVIDREFIKRGLARNEDEFFNATNCELSLLWHAPYYHHTEVMKKAGNDAGYTYVEAFTKGLEAGEGRVPTSTEYVRMISENLYDGIVIPVQAGRNAFSENDSMYKKLDVLFDEVLSRGYEFTDITSLK